MPIVEAVFTVSKSRDRLLGKAIERVMANAVTSSYAEGVIDPVTIRERMMLARAALKEALVKVADDAASGAIEAGITDANVIQDRRLAAEYSLKVAIVGEPVESTTIDTVTSVG